MLHLGGPANHSDARAVPAPRLGPGLPDFHHVTFPHLAGAGIRHMVNFAPPSAPRHLNADGPCSDEEEHCLGWFFRQAGLRIDHYRPETLKRRVTGLLRTLQARSLCEARSLVQANLLLMPRAMDALLIGVTSFFRDPQVIDSLRELALPELSSRCRDMRIWGPACSDGSELYSLAIVLAESNLLHRARLLGTDCRASAVVNARRGTFTADATGSLDAMLIRRYFRLRDGSWRISPVLQSRINWRQADVLRETEPGGWDIILCRNLAIYLRPASAIELWRRLRGALRPGGFLVTGKAEHPGAAEGFRQLAPCLHLREG